MTNMTNQYNNAHLFEVIKSVIGSLGKGTLYFIILRGAQGSGKSTIADKLYHTYGLPNYEADRHYFENGVYRWSVEKVKPAHALRHEEIKKTLIAGYSCVTTSIFTKEDSLIEDINVGLSNGARVLVFDVLDKYQNVHSVKEWIVDKVRKDFVRLEDSTLSPLVVTSNGVPYFDSCS